MDKFIARANIAHLQDRLVTEQNETTRQTLQCLLAEEQAKLAALENDPLKKGRMDSPSDAILASVSDRP